ncbi:MAG: transposase [Chitinophagaceae bacterium]
MVEIGDVQRFETFYHLNSFVGLLPMEHSSGQSENKLSLTVRKHRQLRSDLVESAWTARTNRSCHGALFSGTDKTQGL